MHKGSRGNEAEMTNWRKKYIFSLIVSIQLLCIIHGLEGGLKAVFKVSVSSDWVNQIDNNRDGGREKELCEYRGSAVREMGGDSRLYDALLGCQRLQKKGEDNHTHIIAI